MSLGSRSLFGFLATIFALVVGFLATIFALVTTLATGVMGVLIAFIVLAALIALIVLSAFVIATELHLKYEWVAGSLVIQAAAIIASAFMPSVPLALGAIGAGIVVLVLLGWLGREAAKNYDTLQTPTPAVNQ